MMLKLVKNCMCSVKMETWIYRRISYSQRQYQSISITSQQVSVICLPPQYPYVFVPQARYDYIQKELRAKGKWSFSSSRLAIYNNFYKQFDKIFLRAGIRKKGKFHDCRSTALSNWFAQGLSEYEVMRLAGHSSFSTTHKFYISIKKDHIDKARQANIGLGLNVLA